MPGYGVPSLQAGEELCRTYPHPEDRGPPHWLNGSELGNTLTQMPVTLMDSEECGRALNVIVTTRTYCESGAAARGVRWMEGRVLARKHKGTWFLTGILCSAPTEE